MDAEYLAISDSVLSWERGVVRDLIGRVLLFQVEMRRALEFMGPRYALMISNGLQSAQIRPEGTVTPGLDPARSGLVSSANHPPILLPGAKNSKLKMWHFFKLKPLIDTSLTQACDHAK
jgi:hypothetical protein